MGQWQRLCQGTLAYDQRTQDTGQDFIRPDTAFWTMVRPRRKDSLEIIHCYYQRYKDGLGLITIMDVSIVIIVWISLVRAKLWQFDLYKIEQSDSIEGISDGSAVVREFDPKPRRPCWWHLDPLWGRHAQSAYAHDQVVIVDAPSIESLTAGLPS